MKEEIKKDLKDKQIIRIFGLVAEIARKISQEDLPGNLAIAAMENICEGEFIFDYSNFKEDFFGTPFMKMDIPEIKITEYLTGKKLKKHFNNIPGALYNDGEFGLNPIETEKVKLGFFNKIGTIKFNEWLELIGKGSTYITRYQLLKFFEKYSNSLSFLNKYLFFQVLIDEEKGPDINNIRTVCLSFLYYGDAHWHYNIDTCDTYKNHVDKIFVCPLE